MSNRAYIEQKLNEARSNYANGETVLATAKYNYKMANANYLNKMSKGYGIHFKQKKIEQAAALAGKTSAYKAVQSAEANLVVLASEVAKYVEKIDLYDKAINAAIANGASEAAAATQADAQQSTFVEADKEEDDQVSKSIKGNLNTIIIVLVVVVLIGGLWALFGRK